MAGWVNPDPLTSMRSVAGREYYDCRTLTTVDATICALSTRIAQLRQHQAHPDWVAAYTRDIDHLLSRREYLSWTADTAEDPHA